MLGGWLWVFGQALELTNWIITHWSFNNARDSWQRQADKEFWWMTRGERRLISDCFSQPQELMGPHWFWQLKIQTVDVKLYGKILFNICAFWVLRELLYRLNHFSMCFMFNIFQSCYIINIIPIVSAVPSWITSENRKHLQGFLRFSKQESGCCTSSSDNFH